MRLNVWQTWATQRKVNPKMEEYEHEQLDKMLQIFYTEIRTKDGCEYEPESLKSMLAALDRYLKEHDYKYSIIRDREFHQSNEVSPSTRKRQETQRRERTDSRRRKKCYG
ncbi:unnamed protein product, partial [Pocillopora meandrina]